MGLSELWSINRYAVIGFVLALLSMLFSPFILLPLAAVAFSSLGYYKAHSTRYGGKLAVAGLWIGTAYFSIGSLALYLIMCELSPLGWSEPIAAVIFFGAGAIAALVIWSLGRMRIMY